MEQKHSINNKHLRACHRNCGKSENVLPVPESNQKANQGLCVQQKGYMMVQHSGVLLRCLSLGSKVRFRFRSDVSIICTPKPESQNLPCVSVLVFSKLISPPSFFGTDKAGKHTLGRSKFSWNDEKYLVRGLFSLGTQDQGFGQTHPHFVSSAQPQLCTAP